MHYLAVAWIFKVHTQEVQDDSIMATSLGANRCWKRWSHGRWWPTNG